MQVILLVFYLTNRTMDKGFKGNIDSVGRAIEILGDRWTFKILRDAFFGVRYYDKFQSNVGIATNILSNRLKRLVENGILDKKKDVGDARRISYNLTEKGLDLYPITLALMTWGDKWLGDEVEPPLSLYHKNCGSRLNTIMCCSTCGESISALDISFEEPK